MQLAYFCFSSHRQLELVSFRPITTLTCKVSCIKLFGKSRAKTYEYFSSGSAPNLLSSQLGLDSILLYSSISYDDFLIGSDFILVCSFFFFQLFNLLFVSDPLLLTLLFLNQHVEIITHGVVAGVTRSLRSPVSYRVEHSKRNSISTRAHVLFSV